MQVLNVAPVCLDILVDDVRCDGADLDEPVVLDEYRIAREIAVNDGRIARLVQVAQR